MPGNADKCDSPCEGDPAVMCGNQKRSTIWEMHLCNDAAEELNEAMTEAKEALDFYFEQAGLSMDMGRLMQEGGATLEKAAGKYGAPAAADNAMDCKKGAKDLEQTYERGLKFYKKLLYTYQDAKTLKDGDFSSAQHASAADFAVAQMKEFTPKVLVESQKMFEMVKGAYPPVFEMLKDDPEPTDYASVALTKDDGFKDMYQHAAYATDNSFPPGLSTCSGPTIGSPMVGLSAEECGKVCTATDYPDKCVAFVYYTVEAKDKPRDLCILLSDITSLTTFDCKDAKDANEEGCVPKMGKVPEDVCTPSAICMIKGSEIATGYKAKEWTKNGKCFGEPQKFDGGWRKYELPDEDSDVVKDFMENFHDRTTTTTTTTTFTTTTIMVSSMVRVNNQETPLNDQGPKHGQNIYFDRHNVECPGASVMTGWKLNRGGTSDKIKFMYKCADLDEGVLGQCSEHETGKSFEGKWRQSFKLKKHNVRCKKGKVMKGWRLSRPTGRDISIKYKCCEVSPKLGKCRRTDTGWNDAGKGQTVYLDRHNVQCGDNEILTRWKFKKKGKKCIKGKNTGDCKIRIRYKCCKAPKVPRFPGEVLLQSPAFLM